MNFALMTLPETCEALLGQMVAVNSVNARLPGTTCGEIALASLIEEIAEGWGLATERLPVDAGLFNLLVSHLPNPGGPELLLESHLDTVGVAGMTVRPFAAMIDDERIYGRGTCDTKGSGAAMLWALQQYARGGGRANVGLLFTVDEEELMIGASHFAENQLPGMKDTLRGIIVGEPTMLRPVVAHNGVMRWQTITHGRAAHSATPERGISAISAMVKVITALEADWIPAITGCDPLTGRAAGSINLIRGGTQVNIIPEKCVIELDRRLIPGETATAVRAARDSVLARLLAREPGIVLDHAEEHVTPPLPVGRNLEFLAGLAFAFEKHGLSAEPVGAPYLTNASHYALVGVPSLVLGPGDIAQAHTKDEWLARSQLTSAVRLYGSILDSL